jgi:hypothetical protein
MVNGGGNAGEFAATADAPHVKNPLTVFINNGGKGFALFFGESGAVELVNAQPMTEGFGRLQSDGIHNVLPFSLVCLL